MEDNKPNTPKVHLILEEIDGDYIGFQKYSFAEKVLKEQIPDRIFEDMGIDYSWVMVSPYHDFGILKSNCAKMIKDREVVGL